MSQANTGKDIVGDKILDAYPDRNVHETEFPHHPPSVATPYLHDHYNVVRKRIAQAVLQDEFRNGHFKSRFAIDHGSIAGIILDMQLSGEVTEKQNATLREFGRTWARAIGESKNYGLKGTPLGVEFVTETGLSIAAEALFEMFEDEKDKPNPYPLPDSMKYKDPATRRRELEAIVAKHNAAKLAASAATAAGSSGASISSSITATSSSGRANLRTGISKERLLATLEEYKASTSKDAVLRKAWQEISGLKGALTAQAIDNFSDETQSTIYRMLQSDTKGKPLPCRN